MHKDNEPPKKPKPKYEPSAQIKSTAKEKEEPSILRSVKKLKEFVDRMDERRGEEIANLITSNLAPNDIRELLGFSKLESAEHEHKWVHMEIDKNERIDDQGDCTILYRKDKFYCERCLEMKIIVKEGTRNTPTGYPDWW